MRKEPWNMEKEYWEDVSKENRQVLIQYLKDRLNSDRKELGTVTNERSILLRLSRHITNKSYSQLTERDMKDYFATVTDASRDLTATKIILFYRKILKLKKKVRPDCMEWFEYTTKKQKQKHVDADAVTKYFITQEEYSKIMRVTVDQQTKALFETLYLSGARSSEVCSMTIDSIEVDGGVEITVWESKTKPRKIPLSEYPSELIRWANIHPNKDGAKNPLWFSLSKRAYMKQLTNWAVNFRLTQACHRANIQRHRPHDFRKTRATLMFGENYDDTLMAEFFGWEVETVADRRRQYDLRGHKELKDKVFARVEKPETIEEIKHQRDTQFKDMEKELARQRKIINRLAKKLLDKPVKKWVDQEEK